MIVTALAAAYMLFVPEGRRAITEWEKNQLRKNVLMGAGLAILLRFVVKYTVRVRP